MPSDPVQRLRESRQVVIQAVLEIGEADDARAMTATLSNVVRIPVRLTPAEQPEPITDAVPPEDASLTVTTVERRPAVTSGPGHAPIPTAKRRRVGRYVFKS